MYKPNNYENTQIDRPKVEAGGHICLIKKVEETASKNGVPMIIVFFDFEAHDKQAFLMSQMFKDDIRPEKQWPLIGRKYILCEDSEGNTNRDYKRFITAWEKSNNVKINWNGAANQFANKKVGAVFGPVENEYEGRVYVRNELRWFVSVETALSAEVPALKPLKGETSVPSPAASTSSSDGFMDIPADANENYPFN